ncbi:hypothetical protein CWS72_08745 [Telmatospirillum siberiense]|uniref:Uncharacterized protein n=2 Tax=Telmatospirillum siberiense TaxID=382514 RepID=A0A2N3PX21_9PROT|nr:hypothetical protein CWS72_08745 [Telmatospirillum siberiense]
MRMLSILALGVGAATSPIPAHADEIGDLKALVNELKSQVLEQRAQVKDLKAQINNLNAQVTDQKQQVNAQSAQVQSQSSALQKVEAQQQVLEQKQVTPAPVPTLAANTGKPGYLAIPGTNTSVKIGGYVKLDVTDDVSSNISGSGASGNPASYNRSNFDPTAIPLDKSAASHRNGQVNFSAQESRLNLTTLTNTDRLGEVKSVIEGDFYNTSSNGNFFRLRHAYVSAAGFTAGQTWSTFSDLDTGGPETLDFGGPVGWAATRQAQLRYTAALPTGSLDVAVERPSADLKTATGVTDNHIDRIPDVVVRYSVDPSWGHVAVAGLGRYLTNDAGTTVDQQHANKLVYGVLAGVGIKTIGKDKLVLQTVDGNGIGRYLEQGEGVSAVLLNGAIKPIDIWGGVVGYTHFWTDALRSSAAYGYDHFSTPSGDTQKPIKSLSSVHVNLIWSPISSTDVGIEYIYGHIETSSPQSDTATGTTASKGSASRVEGSVKYSF